jgi:hypothetical protein
MVKTAGEMTVTIAGTHTHTFDWAATGPEDIEQLYEMIEGLARKQGHPARDLAATLMLHTANNPLPQAATARRGVMNWAVFLVMELPTNQPDRPGKVRDYFMRSSIEAEITIEDGSFTAALRAMEFPEDGSVQ